MRRCLGLVCFNILVAVDPFHSAELLQCRSLPNQLPTRSLSGASPVQKNIAYVRLHTDEDCKKTHTSGQSVLQLTTVTPGFINMLKKMKVVSPGAQSGRIGVHLAASRRGHETTNGLLQRTQHPISGLLYLSKPPQPNPDLTSAVGSIEHWRLLLKQLSLLVGSQGSAAIFSKSIVQFGTQFPALATLNPMHSWPEQLAILQNTLQQLPPASAAMAQQSLWWRGCQLITKLLGVSLSRRILHQVQQEQSSQHNG